MSVEVNIAYLPAGAMNTALALQAGRNGYQGTLWFHTEESYQHFLKNKESRHLKGIKLSGINGTTDLSEALAGKDVVSIAPRSWDLRRLLKDAGPLIGKDAIIICATKGFDERNGQYYTPSQVIEQEIPDSRDRLAVLSGPNFARQIALGKITGTTVVVYNRQTAQKVKGIFRNGLFWVDLYEGDPRDVEVIGAFKNVVGLVMGFARTLKEYDENTGAFILQKGLQEAAVLCKAMGGNPEAIMELCGIGDYGLLMNSLTSRNEEAGYKFGTGEWTVKDLMNSDRTIEGVRTAKAVRWLSEEYRVFMPLTRVVYKVLYEGMSPEFAVRQLLRRSS